MKGNSETGRAEKKQRIGVYGGTFNPIHSGHVHILREFIRRLELDRVLLIPTGQPPHKEAPGLASAEDRLAMCRLACREIAEIPVEVSDLEILRQGKSYTAETLEQLHREYPEARLILLMGEDMFLTLHRWRRPDIICGLAALGASLRSADGRERMEQQKAALEEAFHARCYLEDIPWMPISSTQIRAMAAAGESLDGLVAAGVETYIAAHGLYREKEGEPC